MRKYFSRFIKGTSQIILKGTANKNEITTTAKHSIHWLRLLTQTPCLISPRNTISQGMCMRYTEKVSLPKTHMKSDPSRVLIHVSLETNVGRIISVSPRTNPALQKALYSIHDTFAQLL